MEQNITYRELHTAFLKDLDAIYEHRSEGLLSVDLKRKWDACSEMLLLEKLQKQCLENSVPREFYNWVTARLHEFHVSGSCY